MGDALVNAAAQLKCSFGQAPSKLNILPRSNMCESQPLANISDHIPMVNILPFGMCTAPTNPMVIAALGAPVPCVPVVPAPWIPCAPMVMSGGLPVLTKGATCMCAYAGVITVNSAGATKSSIG